MATMHETDVLHRHPTNKAREAFAIVLAIPAVVLTGVLVVGLFDMATSNYIGGEVLAGQIIATVVALLAAVAWTGVVALHKSARRDLRRRPRRMMVTALLSMVGCAVLAELIGFFAGPTSLSVVLYGAVAVAGVTAFVAALRA